MKLNYVPQSPELVNSEGSNVKPGNVILKIALITLISDSFYYVVTKEVNNIE